MDCHIVFAPDLQVNNEEFIAAWNDTAECRDLAVARLVSQPPADFPLDPDLLQQGLVLLASAVGGIVGGAIKDVLKDKLAGILKKLSKKPDVQVQSVRQPDGTYLIVVTREGT